MSKLTYKNYLEFVEDVLIRAGLSQEQAKSAAEVMAFADYRGIESHGTILLKTYIERIEKGIISKVNSDEWLINSGSLAVLDGKGAMGHYLGQKAMNKAVEKASENGIGMVFVRNSTHYGASGYYTSIATKNKMVGFSTTNTFPLMAPTGGSEKVLGNNPMSYAIPQSKGDPIIVDIATSVVAAGKLLVAESKNEEIPNGWALDSEGQPTTDPHAGYLGGGSLVPVGNHKGYGLSLAMDVLAGVLSGSDYGTNVNHSTIGFVMMAIDINQLTDEKTYENSIEELSKMVLESKKRPGVSEIFLPGEIEQREYHQRLENGFNINRKLMEEFQYITEKLGININHYI